METRQLDEIKFEYRVSVIIPIYNVEEYLEACLDSLLAQTIPQEEMEVLMINDGSPDGSLGVCLRYALEHPNFRVISQENQGVSAARNNGIRNAKGRYLLYLDGDDLLSPETVKNVADFFDEHYDEVDVVTYPLVYLRGDNKVPHWRNELQTESSVIDLDHYPFLCQTTINICVKNKGADNIYFDTELAAYEDQTYNLAQCMPLRRIGFCREAEYLYCHRESSATSNFSHPYHIAQLLIETYETFLDRYNNAPYVQALVLYDINWRVYQDTIYPYHYSPEKLAEFQRRLGAVLARIDTWIICNYPKIDTAHKFYLLSLKTQCHLSVSVNKNQLAVVEILPPVTQDGRDSPASQVLYTEDKLLIVLSRTHIEGDKLYILAYLMHVAFSFMEKPQFFAVVDDEREIEIPLFLSQHSCYKTKLQTNLFWAFHFEIDLREMSTLRFVLRFQDKTVETKYQFTNKGILPQIGRYFLTGNSRALLYQGDVLRAVDVQSKDLRRVRQGFERSLRRKHTKQWLARHYMSFGKKGPVWLYTDAYHAVDNAYVQFQHDFAKQDGVTRYYVCKKDCIDWQSLFTPEQYPYVIERDSFWHKKLFAQADKILAAFVDRASYVPFDGATIAYYWDLFHFEVIYLQHGIMHAELSNMYSKEKVFLVDKIVASTRFEQETFVNKLAFRPQDVLCCGMPRLDKLECPAPEKKLLFAPSWRYYLVSQSEGRWARRANFTSSDYYWEIREFLTNPRLLSALEKSGYRLEIKLHPNFAMYESDFHTLESSHVTVVDKAELHTYAGCITDVSSYMYDLFYLGIPVFTHIFDHDRFKAGLHNYRDLCWPMETQYPFYRSDQDGLVTLLARFMDAPAAVVEEFRSYVKDMFFPCADSHAEALYQRLIGG